MRTLRTSFLLSLVSAIALVAGAAGAISLPLGSVNMTLSAGGTPIWSGTFAGSNVGSPDPNAYTFTNGSVTKPAATLTWSGVNGDLDPFVSGNWALVNTSGVTQIFTVTVDLPVAPVLPTSLMYGSSTISVSDANGSGSATLASVLTTAVYDGRIDFAAVTPTTDLFAAPYSLVAGLLATVGDTKSFGVAPGSVPGPGVTSAIGIQHTFSLTAGDRATFNSIFSVVPVPEPGTLVLAASGLLGLGMMGRRR